MTGLRLAHVLAHTGSAVSDHIIRTGHRMPGESTLEKSSLTHP